MNPLVEEYLAKKYPEKFAQLAAEREAATKTYDKENEAPGVGGNLLMGLVGALKSDKSYADVAKDERMQREAERENVVKPYDEKIGALTQEMGVSDKAFEGGRARTKAVREDSAFDLGQQDLDPNSPRSKSAQQTVQTFAPKFAPLVQGKSAAEIERMMPWVKSKMDQDFKASESAKDRAKDLEVESMRVATKPKPGTKGQDALDRNFSSDYNDFIVKGGYGTVRSQLAALKDSIKTLETDKSISGPIRGAFPDTVRSLTNPTAVNVKEQIASIVQNSLRPILGAQFTEKEGELLIKRTFNDRLPPEVNAKRAKRLYQQIQTMANQKLEASNYFEENGTLKGYKGKIPSMEDLETIDYDNIGPSSDGKKPIEDMTIEEMKAELGE